MSEDPAVRELFCFEGYDPQHRIGYFFHLTRWYLDPTLWLEQVQVYLPDGNYLVRHNWSRANPLSETGGAMLKLLHDERARCWRIQYRGPVMRATAQELSRGPLTERPQQRLELDVLFQSAYSPWELGNASADHTTQRWLVEQPGRVSGQVNVGGEVQAMDGVGYRNHSRGPRMTATLYDHCWVHGQFPSGRAFAVIHIRDAHALSRLAQAVVWDRGRVYPARCEIPPLLGDTDHPLTAPRERFTMDIHSDLGVMHIEAHAQRNLPHSTTSGGEWLDGVTADRALAQLVTYERPTLFFWNDEVGAGHTEQSRSLG
jgi:hypothetical protein